MFWFLMGSFGIFAGMLMYMWAGIIWAALRAFVILIWDIFLSCYRSMVVEPKLNENDFMENKLLEKRLEEAAQQQRHDDEILGQHNRIIRAALNSVNEMRMRYPYAEELLYEEYQRRFPSASVGQLREFEDKIRESHLRREMDYSVRGKTNTSYTLADLNGLNPIEQKREDPLVMKIFKINSDYLLQTNNIDTGEQCLLQSKDYFTIIRTQVKILESQNKLREAKKNIKSQEVHEIFDNVNSTTQDFRRNRMGFID